MRKSVIGKSVIGHDTWFMVTECARDLEIASFVGPGPWWQIVLLCLLDLYICTSTNKYNKSISKCKTIELGNLFL